MSMTVLESARPERLLWPLTQLFFLLVVLAASFLAMPKFAAAAVRTWDGGGATNNWSEAANWSSNLVPTAADSAVFNATSTKNAVIDTNVSVVGIAMNSGFTGTLTQSAANTITITGAGDFIVSSGTFIGGTGTISVADQMRVSGGTFNSTSGVLLVDGGDFVVSAGAFNPGSGTVKLSRLAITVNVNVTENFNNLEISEGNNLAVTIASGDTVIVDGVLTLTDGVVNTGALKARGTVVQEALFDGGTSILDFDNDTLAQTYTVNGGTSPSLRLDSPADASDDIQFAASGTLSTLTIAATFGSNPIPISNPSNVPVAIKTWNQAAGDYDASAQSAWSFQSFTRSAGTFIAPDTVTSFGLAATWNVPVVQEFRNFVVNKNPGVAMAVASGDTLVVSGTATFNEGLSNSNTIQVSGNVKVNPTYDGGTTVLSFIGSADQDFNLAGAEGSYNGDVVVNKLSGVVSLSSGLTLNASGQDLTIQLGTFSLNGNALTINGRSGRLIVQSGANLQLQGGETLTFNAGQPTLNTGSTVTYTGDGDGVSDGFTITRLKGVYHNLVIDSLDFGGSSVDTFVLGGALDVNGNLTIAHGTLDATLSNYSINLAGNWSNSGSFTPNQGTVTLDGASQSLIGGSNFYNLSKTATGAATLTTDANFAQNISGTLTLIGRNASTKMLLRSSVDGSRARITPTGPRTVRYLDVKDIDNDDITELPCLVGCLNSGNNENWVFASYGLTPISGNTTESSGTATYTLVLNSQPTATVTFTLTSTDTTEGTVSPATVSFSTTNWATPRTVTVTGVDDTLNDGSIDYAIHHVISGSDLAFSTLPPFDVAVTNNDNETVGAGILVSPSTGNTTEAGGTATFTIVLAAQPQTNVSIDLSSTDPTEGSVAASTVVFTTANWSTPSTITITGVNDALDDGDVPYSIATAPAVSGDPAYNGMDGADVSLSNLDDDAAGYTLSAISGNTTEAGGTATFTIVLNSQPTANVTLSAASNDSTEGSVLPASLTFNSANWNAPQTVTVTGVNDQQDDGDIAYSVGFPTVASTDSSYNSLSPGLVAVTNLDDDTAGATVSAVSGNTSEAGGTATFTVVLNTQPSANVGIGLATSNTNEATVAPASLIFTTANWNVPQTVTLTGVDDDIDDGDVGFTALVAAAVSTDQQYNGLNPSDLSLSNIDNDTAGFIFTPISGNTTEENETTATLTVRLATRPFADVTLFAVSSDTTEGEVSPGSLVFSTADWSVPKTITVTGAEDAIDDGDVSYSVNFTGSVSTDSAYAGLVPGSISLLNIDNDASGFIVSPASGNTAEDGTTATFTVRLSTQPVANVTIPVSSNDSSEGVAAVASLSFTTTNWFTPQTISVSGTDDLIDDGDLTYSIILAAATSTDSGYAGADPTDVTLTNIDNDTAGVTVSTPTDSTTEAGGTATFTVVLNTQPTADVHIGVIGGDSTEATNSPTRLTFTVANWNVPQAVTLTGVDDTVLDGDITYSTITNPTSSVDPAYDGIDPSDVTNVNLDDEVVDVIVTPHTGNTTEAGGASTFSVSLNAQPSADVIFAVMSDSPGEAVAAPSSLTFDATNWFTPQLVTVTGVNDDVDDGDSAYAVVIYAASSADPAFNGFDPGDLTISNLDDDTAGISASAPSTSTSEDGGAVTVSVTLNSKPTADVIIDSVSSNAAEATATPAQLHFTPINWNVPQVITLTGLNDAIDDGDVSYSLNFNSVTSTDPKYNAFSVPNLPFSNLDNDTAGVIVSPASGNTTEAGGTATFTVVLGAEPVSIVTIPMASDDATEGSTASSSITFTPTDWNIPKTVTVTGIDDAIDDGDITYSIIMSPVSSADRAYQGLNPNDVTMVNVDNDSRGFVLSAPSGPTTEAGGTATFTVTLASQPVSSVTVVVTSGNVFEGTVSGPYYTFTTANWNVPKIITVTGVNDSVVDGPIVFPVTVAGVSDGSYGGVSAQVQITNNDNDSANIVVSPIAGNTTESGGTTSFTVVLSAQPSAEVAIGVTTGIPSEVTVTPSDLRFNSSNWNVPQTVVVTGVNDNFDDGDMASAVVVNAASSADPAFNGMDAGDLTVTNLDDDTAGVTASAPTGDTSEGGGTSTFTVVLNSQPTSAVTVHVTSSSAEATVTPMTMTFDGSNWNQPQTATASGADDSLADGDQPYSIVFQPVDSTDAKYSGFDPADINLINLDNDTAGVIVSAASGNTTETGGTATFTVVLGAEPVGLVTIPMASDNLSEGSTASAEIVFTPTDWNTPKTITVTGANDSIDDGDVAYNIILSPANSTDRAYQGLNPNDVALSNIDDESAGIIVSAVSGNTTEAGGTATFTVQLGTQPTADVTMSVNSDNPAEGIASVSSLTFNQINWNIPQTVTVTGVSDSLRDGSVAYNIVLGTIISSDRLYDAMSPINVGLINDESNPDAFVITDITAHTTEAGGTATFTVRLSSRPITSAIVVLNSSNVAEGTVSGPYLVFTVNNWDTPQTVTVTGVDDSSVDGPKTFSVRVAGAADSAIGAAVPMFVSVVNDDDDVAGVVIDETDGLTHVTEGSADDTYTVTLASAPAADVTITIFDDSQVDVDYSTFTFTPADWNVPRVITVVAVEDGVSEGAHTGTITHWSSSADPDYNAISVDDVIVSITDNNISVTIPVSGGGTELAPSNRQIVSTVSLLSPNGGESFTAGEFVNINWSAPAASISYINVELSIDGGATFTDLANNLPNSDVYTWKVPNISTTKARIRIEGTDNVSIIGTDTSDGPFTIVGETPVAVEPPTTTVPVEGISADSPGYTALSAGDFVRGNNISTVFQMVSNGQGGLIARPFIDSQTFFTYADSFSKVKTIADPQFALYTIGAPMLPNPGVSLVKIVSSERVYMTIARSNGGVELRQISSESLAITMFGADWNKYVIDLPPTIWSKFIIGAPLTDPVPVDLSRMRTRDQLNGF